MPALCFGQNTPATPKAWDELGRWYGPNDGGAMSNIEIVGSGDPDTINLFLSASQGSCTDCTEVAIERTTGEVSIDGKPVDAKTALYNLLTVFARWQY
jgi:hypothetical protein